MWEWLTRRRTGLDRYVITGIGVLIAGVVFWAWGIATGLDSTDPIVFYARGFVVVGIVGTLIPLGVILYRRQSHRAEQ
jgi:hypothetical protein